MRRLGKSIFAVVVFFGWVLGTVQSAEQPKKIEIRPTGTFRVNVSNGYLSLVAERALLTHVFEEIGKQAKISFDSNIGPEEIITINLERVPLEDGIRQLAKNVSVFYTENPKDKTRRISRVVVVAEGKESVPVQTKTSPQAEKVKEPAPQAPTTKPAPQSEPFKFEFDPGKFSGKEKSGKQP